MKKKKITTLVLGHCLICPHTLSTFTENSHSPNTPYSLAGCCNAQHPLKEHLLLSSSLSILILHTLSINTFFYLQRCLASWISRETHSSKYTDHLGRVTQVTRTFLITWRFKEGSKCGQPQQNCLLIRSFLEHTKCVSHLQANQLPLSLVLLLKPVINNSLPIIFQSIIGFRNMKINKKMPPFSPNTKSTLKRGKSSTMQEGHPPNILPKFQCLVGPLLTEKSLPAQFLSSLQVCISMYV